MASNDVLQIRIDHDLKEGVTRMYEQRGTTVSQAVRAFLSDELAAHTSALDAFDAIMSSADARVASSGMREPTIDELNDYIAQVRSERADASLAAS